MKEKTVLINDDRREVWVIAKPVREIPYEILSPAEVKNRMREVRMAKGIQELESLSFEDAFYHILEEREGKPE